LIEYTKKAYIDKAYIRILKSTISPQRVNKVIARRQEVEWAIERQHEEQEIE
jgi:hypothetical protein